MEFLLNENQTNHSYLYELQFTTNGRLFLSNVSNPLQEQPRGEFGGLYSSLMGSLASIVLENRNKVATMIAKNILAGSNLNQIKET